MIKAILICSLKIHEHRSELNRIKVYSVKHVATVQGIEYPEMHLVWLDRELCYTECILGRSPQGQDRFKTGDDAKSNIILVKEVEADNCISYGRIFKHNVTVKSPLCL